MPHRRIGAILPIVEHVNHCTLLLLSVAMIATCHYCMAGLT
jgi:hypothetical protein